MSQETYPQQPEAVHMPAVSYWSHTIRAVQQTLQLSEDMYFCSAQAATILTNFAELTQYETEQVGDLRDAYAFAEILEELERSDNRPLTPAQRQRIFTLCMASLIERHVLSERMAESVCIYREAFPTTIPTQTIPIVTTHRRHNEHRMPALFRVAGDIFAAMFFSDKAFADRIIPQIQRDAEDRAIEDGIAQIRQESHAVIIEQFRKARALRRL